MDNQEIIGVETPELAAKPVIQNPVRNDGTYAIKHVFRLNADEADTDIIRVHPSLIGSGREKFSRNDLIKITNEKNGLVSLGYARGAGQAYSLYKSTIAISYDSRQRLGIGDSVEADLTVTKATFLEQERFYLFQQKDLSARRAHRYSLQGVALGVMGVMLGAIPFIQMLFV